MIKSLSAALLAVSMLAAPAFAAGTDKTPAAATEVAKPAPTGQAKVKSHAASHHRAIHHKLNKHSSLRGHKHVAKLGQHGHAKQHLSKAQLRPAAAKRG